VAREHRRQVVSTKGKANRLYPRIFFSAEDGIVASFSPPGNENEQERLVARVMDVSEGGMGLTFNKKENGKVHKGDRLIVVKVEGESSLEKIGGTEVEVKWVMDHALLEHTAGFGCQFMNTDEGLRDLLREFVNLRLLEQEGQISSEGLLDFSDLL